MRKILTFIVMVILSTSFLLASAPTIQPKDGLGIIKLGMKVTQLKKAIGLPDALHSAGVNLVILEYSELGIMVLAPVDSDMVVAIRTEDPKYFIEGTNINTGSSLEQAQKTLGKHDDVAVDLEDEVRYFTYTNGLTIIAQGDKIIAISIWKLPTNN